MAQNETWLSHDLMNPVKVQYLDGNLFSMDNAGNLIGVILTKDGVAYSGGGTVSANVIRADGGTVAVTGALSGNVATVVLPQAAYAVPGVASVVVKLTVSGEVTTIGAVVANVYESTTSTTIDPGTIIPSIQTLVNQINTAVSSIPADYSALWTSLAPAFRSSTAYTAGQYVTYDGGLYRFVTDHAAGSWSSSDVTAAKLGNDISDLKSVLASYFDEGTEYGEGTYVYYGSDVYILPKGHEEGVSWANTTKYSAQAFRQIRRLFMTFTNEYSASNTYSVGDYVIYRDYLYRCITAIATPEEWNSDHWTSSNIISALNLKITAEKTARQNGDAANEGKVAAVKNEFEGIYFKYQSDASWESGTYNAQSGNKTTDSTKKRSTLDFGIPYDIYGVKSSDASYVFNVYAWDKNGSYVGAYRTNGTFATSGTLADVNEFVCSGYPDYTMRVVLQDAASKDLTKILFAYIRENGIDKITQRIKQSATYDKELTDDFVHGYYLTTNGEIGSTVSLTPTSGSMAYIVAPCKTGDIFVITGIGGNASRLWCFTNEDLKILSNSASSLTATDLELKAYHDGYFICNANWNNSFKLVQKTVYEAIGDSISLFESENALCDSRTVLTVGHRGDDIVAPQCTAPAFVAAKKRGIMAVENDIELSRDNKYVMWHDETLERLGVYLFDINGYFMYTDGTNYYWYDSEHSQLYTWNGTNYESSSESLSSLTQCKGEDYATTDLDLSVLKRIDFGAYKGSKFKGTQILTFAEWVLLCKQLGLEIWVDKKIAFTDSIASELVGIVKKYGMLDHTSWLAGTQTPNIRAYDPNARCGTIEIPSNDTVQTYAPYNTGRGFFFDPNLNILTQEMVELAQSNGFDICCYYVDYGYYRTDKSTILNKIREAVAFGVTAITTDHYRVSDAYENLYRLY